jgi:uncharacterized membrane protein
VSRSRLSHPVSRSTASSVASAVREETYEARFEAAPAVVCIIVLQLALTIMLALGDWTLWVVPWWVPLLVIIPEALLLVPLVSGRLSQRLELLGHHTTVVVALLGLISLATGLLLLALIASLISGGEQSGGQLLAKGLIIWTTNAITFGLWFWNVDQGGPARRRERNPLQPDFLFPQWSTPDVAQPGWSPRLFDYLYFAATNAMAFSPTDTLPLTRLAKQLMLAEASISAFTVLLVIARSVNIFK